MAESSVTIPDISYVIDFCLTKKLNCDPETNYTSLQLEWADKNSCEQRKGRCGRVKEGRVFRLVFKTFYERNCPDEHEVSTLMILLFSWYNFNPGSESMMKPLTYENVSFWVVLKFLTSCLMRKKKSC